MNNSQDKINNIFTYPLFWVAVITPILISILFACVISNISQLSFDISSFESFELFLTYMHLPIIIASLALPFGTVAASNFRATQFQKGLNIQQVVMEQGKENFIRSMYLNELEYFKGKFKGIIKHGGFKLITEDDGHLIFARMYELSLENGDYPFKKNIDLFEIISDYYAGLEVLLIELEKNTELKSNDKLLNLMLILVDKTRDISHSLGVKVIQERDSFKVMIDLVNDIFGITRSLYQEEVESFKEERIKIILDKMQLLHCEYNQLSMDSTTIDSIIMHERIDDIKSNLKHSKAGKSSTEYINSFTFNLHI